MASTLSILLNLAVTGPAMGIDQIEPERKEVTVTGATARRGVALPEGESVTLDAGGTADGPRYWFFYNDSSVRVIVSLDGSSDDLVLDPGDLPQFIRSELIPVARSTGAAAHLIAAVIT